MDPATMMLLAKAGMATYQAIDGYTQKQKAEKEAKRAAMQLRQSREEEIVGPQIDTLGTELALQSIGQQAATMAANLKSSGAAGVLGGIPSLANISSDRALDIAADLNDRIFNRDVYEQQVNQEIRKRNMERQRAEFGATLQGAQAASAEGRQRIQNAGLLAGEAVLGYGMQKLDEKPLYDRTQTGTSPTETPRDINNQSLLKTETPGFTPTMSDEQFRQVQLTPLGERPESAMETINKPLPTRSLAMGVDMPMPLVGTTGTAPSPAPLDDFNRPLPMAPLGMTGTAPSPVPLPMFSRPLPMAPLGMTGTAPSPVPLDDFNRPLPMAPLGMSSVPVPDPYYSFNIGSPTGEAAMVGGFPAPENVMVVDRVTGLPVLKQYPNSFPIMPPGLR